MASILQHQVESKVNDLYFKMQRHAQIIMKLSVELDNLKGENEELRNMVNQDRRIIKKLYQSQNTQENDIHTSQHPDSIHQEYKDYGDDDALEDNGQPNMGNMGN